jgi:TolB-like protein
MGIPVLVRRLTPAFGLVLAAACFAGPSPTVAPAPSRVQELERARRRDTSDVDVAELLGAAYLGVNRASDARALFASSHVARPDDPVPTILLGLADEDMGDVAAARGMYASYLAVAWRGPYVPEAQGRLDRLTRDVWAEEARKAVAADSAVGTLRPGPEVVVVLPFAPGGGDDRVPALATAMSDMLRSDLAASRQLRVVDRGRVTALLDALSVLPEDRSSPDVARHVGRLLRAGAVVQGSLDMQEGGSLQLQVNVVRLGPDSEPEIPPMRDRAPLRQVAFLERRVTRFLFEHLEVEWSKPVMKRMASSWTAEPDAWVPLGRGILAMDAGDYAAAQRSFAEAGRAKGPPDARERAARAAYASAAARPPAPVAWRIAREAVQRRLVARLESTPETGYGSLEGGLADRGRAVAAELLGEAGLGLGTTIDLVFVTGGGSQ